MPVFVVMLRGEDFILDVDGTPTRLGFYTTRWVRARTPEEAELAAVTLVKNDQTLASRVHRDATATSNVVCREHRKVSLVARFQNRRWVYVLGHGYRAITFQ